MIREDGELKLMLAAGADANHDPRTFTFPIGEAHLTVIRSFHLVRPTGVASRATPAGGGHRPVGGQPG